MILKNIIALFIVMSLFAMSLIGVFSWQVAEVSAETDSFSSGACPINGEIQAKFQKLYEVYEVEDQLMETVTLVNPSDYAFGDLRIGVAAYENEGDRVPAYFTVLKDRVFLPPQEETTVPLELSLAAMEAGDYVVKVFATQGDETAVLGNTLLNFGSLEQIKISKSTPKEKNIPITVMVGEETYAGETIVLTAGDPIEVEIKTQNQNDLPLLGNSVLAVISEGDMPLGTAIRVDKTEDITLIPGSKRLTKLFEPFATGGDYSIYATAIDPNAIQSLAVVPVTVADTANDVGGSYVSQIGVSDYPLNAGSAVVACVDFFGNYDQAQRFPEPLGAEFSVSVDGVERANHQVTTDGTETDDYFAFFPNLSGGDLELTVDLLEERYLGLDVDFEEELSPEEVEERMVNNMSAIDTITLTFQCDNEFGCDEKEAGSVPYGPSDTSSHQSQLWFFAGILVAASLLLFLLLRRIEPKSTGVVVKDFGSRKEEDRDDSDDSDDSDEDNDETDDDNGDESK